MLAAVLTDFNELVLEEVAVPEPGMNEVVVRITTHETFALDGGLTHFLEGRMDASFGTTPLAMQKAVRLMDRGLIDPEAIITHSFPLAKIHEAIEVMAQPNRNKVIINP